MTLTLDVDKDVPETVVGDPNRLRQIVMNLVTNAIKFTDQGSVRVQVQPLNEAAEPALVHFSVQDTGVGVAPDEQERIFQRFIQADASLRRGIGGAGLGLAISSHLVTAMGGRIWLDSDPGKGSTFHFTARLEPGTMRQRAAVPDLGTLAGQQPFAHKAVLLAEDNAFNQAVAREMLSKLGCRVTVASNGKQAIAQVQDNHFDLVLMDLQMPEMDGVEAARRIRELERYRELSPIPIVALTAHALSRDRERCLAAGMDDYISKPINSSALVQVLCRSFGISADELGHGAPFQDTPALGAAPADDDTVVDLGELRRRIGDDSDDLKEIVRLFAEEGPAEIGRLREALAADDAQAAARMAHTLKGVYGNLSAPRLRHLARAIEIATKEGHTDEAAALTEEMEREFAEAMACLMRACEDNSDGGQSPGP